MRFPLKLKNLLKNDGFQNHCDYDFMEIQELTLIIIFCDCYSKMTTWSLKWNFQNSQNSSLSYLEFFPLISWTFSLQHSFRVRIYSKSTLIPLQSCIIVPVSNDRWERIEKLFLANWPLNRFASSFSSSSRLSQGYKSIYNLAINWQFIEILVAIYYPIIYWFVSLRPATRRTERRRESIQRSIRQK